MGNRGYDLAWGSVLRSLTWSHKVLDKVSGGRLGKHFPGGQQVVWITTLGRKSGEWRRNPLLAVREDGDPSKPWLITGSNAGQAAVPAWVFNLRSHDRGTIEVEGRLSDAVFTEATGDDRDRLYRQLTQIWKSYEMYERHAGREIPVFRVAELPK